MNDSYESPEVKDLGSLEDMTLQDKTFGPADGLTFNGASIRNAS